MYISLLPKDRRGTFWGVFGGGPVAAYEVALIDDTQTHIGLGVGNGLMTRHGRPKTEGALAHLPAGT